MAGVGRLGDGGGDGGGGGGGGGGYTMGEGVQLSCAG